MLLGNDEILILPVSENKRSYYSYSSPISFSVIPDRSGLVNNDPTNVKIPVDLLKITIEHEAPAQQEGGE